MCFFGTEWLWDWAGQKLPSTDGAQMFGKNFYIKPEKALKKRKDSRQTRTESSTTFL